MFGTRYLARDSRRRRLKGKRGRGTKESEKVPILGMIQRGGELGLKVVDNVQQKTIKPLIEKHVTKGSTAYTEEYVIYEKMTQWGYVHHTVNHGIGDDDADGFNEIHVKKVLDHY